MHLPAKKIEGFLRELANLHDKGFEKFSDRYSLLRPSERTGETTSSFEKEVTTEEMRRDFYLSLRERVQMVWHAPDLRRKRYGVFLTLYWVLLRSDILVADFLLKVPSVLLLPPLGPLEMALDYLLTNADRTRFCLNPDCPAPYFFAKRRNQKYCSEDCAQRAKREAKLRWWKEHGPKWRNDRAAKGKTGADRPRKTRTSKKGSSK
jgi:hypothetical protein